MIWGVKMKAVILNGVNKNSIIYDSLIKELQARDYSIHSFYLPELEVSSCLGCFGCWIKTPGICVIDDFGRDILKTVVASDLIVYLSPVTFGGYSYHVKKAVDRLLPILLPHFTKIGGEIHHLHRYSKRPSSLVVGVLPCEDQESAEIFKTMAARNSLNWQPPAWTARVITENVSPDEVEKIVMDALSEMEVFQ